jgi:hypothetical protein
MSSLLAQVRERLRSSPLDDAALRPRIFICNRNWRFILFANLQYRAGGINYLGFNVFLRRCVIEHNRLVGPSGTEVSGERTLVYFMAHELTHSLEANLLGRYRQWRLPAWQKEGYADYVAREKGTFNFGWQLSAFQKRDRELDPKRSGLYLRYDLLVTYLLDFKGLDPKTLLSGPFDRAALEQELERLKT